MKSKSIKTLLIMLILFILLISTVIIINTQSNALTIINESNIYINEIMPKNTNTTQDIDNEYADYIEIYNNYDYDINLSGYYLSDELMSNKKWKFPNIIIKSKEYLIIYASGKDKCDLSLRECHANFKLKDDGETISLLNNDGKVISKVKYPKITTNDTSYSLINKQYKLTIGTPYTKNEDIKVETDITKDVIINEVSATNPEAIELKNITEQDIELKNYYIKDKSGSKYEFKNEKIKANSYLVVYGSDTSNITNNQINIGFRINNSNEILYLYKNNQLIDTFVVGKMSDNISKGRNENLDTVIYKNITIGKENSKTYYGGFSLIPTFSNDGGYVEKGTKVKLSTKNNSTIYYTLDGSTPTTKSKKYNEPIVINNNTVIKAITYKDGFIESDIESRTYLTGRKHDLPVVSISTDNNYLYGSKGIFTTGPNASPYYPYKGANFWEDIEVPITFEYYEDGELALNFTCGMKIFGGWSRGEAQKSLSIYLRKKYGLQEITYPFFEDNINTFSRLVLRNAGQEYGKTKLKDAFLQEVLDGQMDIDKQDYKPVVVYINNKYFGIYNIREKIDATYIENHYGLKEEDIDLIQTNATVVEGSMERYNNLLNYVRKHDMSKEESYEYVKTQVDIQELINYWVVETYYGQKDPGNIKFYKSETTKWRWLLYDIDQTFESEQIRWNLPFSSNVPGHAYTLNTTLMTNLMKNSTFRAQYIETFIYHLNSTFKPERMNKILDKMVQEIQNEMPYHIDRWYYESINTSQFTLKNMQDWKNYISKLKYYINARHKNALKTIKEGLGLTDEEYKKYF